MSYCWNESDHRREAQRDFERGRPDHDQYDHHTWDGCKEAYTQEYDRLKREDERRQEERRYEEERQERREIERQRYSEYLRSMAEQEEAAYFAQQQEQRPEEIDEVVEVDPAIEVPF